MLNSYSPWTIPVPGGYTNDLHEPAAAELINLERLAAEPKDFSMRSSLQSSVALKEGWLLTSSNEPAFTSPQFYFGDLVQWTGEDANGIWAHRTGQITGMHFTRLRTWQYQVRFDADPATGAESDLDVSCAESLLQLKQAPHRVQQHPTARSEWLTTVQAAQVLGLSPEQLRRLRRKGLFKVGHHCRDTSFPNSGLSRWQWHVVRCGQALAVPPEKRSLPSNRV